MPDTGWKIAGTAASVDADDTSDAAWANPTNVTSDDASYASSEVSDASKSDTTDYLTATNFNMGVPAGAGIIGVEVRIQRYAGPQENPEDPFGMTDHTVQLVVAGTATGDNNADLVTEWPATATDKDYGGATDTWSLALTAAQVNASTFGVTVRGLYSSGQTTEAFIDAIWIKVYYVEGGNRGYIIG